MSTTKPAKTRAESLMTFCRKIGIPDVEIQQPETPFSYDLSTIVHAKNLKAAVDTDYTDLIDAFGESLNLEVSLQNVFYLEIKEGKVTGNLAQWIAFISGKLDTTGFKVEIKINKAAIIKKIGLDDTRYNCLFFFFEHHLTALLRGSLFKLDKELFRKPDGAVAIAGPAASDQPIVIVVSDADIHFAGEMLTIAGESMLDDGAGPLGLLQGRSANESEPGAAERERANREQKYGGCFSRLHLQFLLGAAKSDSVRALGAGETALTTMQEQIKKYRIAALENPSLVGHQFVHLTPLHFGGTWKKRDTSPLETILARHFVNMCILCTANRSTFDDKEAPFESVYNSSERTATLSLVDEPTVEITTDSLESLAKWLYSGKGTDQRTVFQNIVARELYSDNPKDSYNTFINRMPHLLKEAIWHYQVFVDGKITKHFEEMQKVAGYVSDVNKKISEAIDSVTKSLTDALLATVGVLVLTVLAALVKKDTSIEIFRISMQIYSAYLFFYALYRMGSTFHSYRLLSKDADAQLMEYKTALGDGKVDELSSPLKRRRRQFHIWFWITVVLYAGLAGSILWAGKKGPQLLIDRGIISPAPARTPESSSSTPPAENSEPQTDRTISQVFAPAAIPKLQLTSFPVMRRSCRLDSRFSTLCLNAFTPSRKITGRSKPYRSLSAGSSSMFRSPSQEALSC